MSLLDRYAAAEAVLPDTFASLVHGGLVVPAWIGDGPDFTYVERTATGKRHCRVDGSTGEVRPLFDHEKIAAQLSELLGVALEAGALPLGPPRIVGDAALYQLGPFELSIDPDSSTVTTTDLPGVGVDESLSPDGARVVFRREDNLWVRERATGVETQLTADGAPAYEYGRPIDVTKSTITMGWLGITLPPSVVWSPDSTRILTPRIDQRKVKEMHLVAAKPPGGGPPKLHSYRYAMVGDELVPMAELVSIDVTTGVSVVSHSFVASYFDAVRTKQLWWGPTGEAMCLWYGRGLKSLTLFAMDPVTGAVREVHEKTSDLLTMPTSNFLSTSAIRSLPSGETLWWSEASGWGHLSVIAIDGSERILTSGDWAVVDIVAADLDHVWFTAVGREPGIDPYVRSFYRVGLHGGEIETLLSDGLDHLVHGSPDARRFVDVASYLDAPPVSSLLAGDGSKIAVLTRADASDLFAAGYQSPERFCVTGADGETDIWGVLYRPQGLDEQKRYPILDDSYPGPQVEAAQIRFPRSGSPISHHHGASMAALGFAVVVIDGRGTPLRGVDFQMHAWITGDDQAGLDDHVAAIRQLGERYPWLDLDRVGMYGHSGGGYEAARALMLHPEFYRVAVAAAGGHDAAPYHALWGESYVAPAGSEFYEQHAVQAHVENLVGKLFLIHGEMDDNVTPYITIRLVDALITADKDFDLLIVPNEDHGLLARQHYWWRRRWDYFVRHLMGEDPPAYKITPRTIDLETLGS